MAKRRPGGHPTRPESSQEPDDIFVARVLHFGKWASSNQQALTIIGIVFVIAIAGFVYYWNYRQTLYAQASQELELVHQSVAIQDREGARDDLVVFLDRFGGTPYEGEARLLLGDLYLRDGSPQQALAVLEPLGASPRNPIEFQAATLLGAAYEDEGRFDDAEATYISIAERSELNFQVRDALVAAARIRDARGDAQGAVELYERLLEELDADSPQRGLYEMRIEEIVSIPST